MDESNESKLMRKIKEDPMVPLGILGMIGTCAYGFYKYKTTSKTMLSTSLFLMQLRVAAQSAVVGAMTIGMIYNMGKILMNKDEEKKKLN